jgi:putative molybdopterin biosynthesis protein
MGILAAARAFGLDFVPVAEEPYDLVTTSATLAAGVLDPLLDLIGDPRFAASVEALGGYSTAETGRRIR